MFTIDNNAIYARDESGELLAEITFPETEPGVFTIDHTYVDWRYRGEGLAAELVRAAVEEIRRRGGQVRAVCSYAAAWLEREMKETGGKEA